MLLRHGIQFGILYATHIASEGFQRFSISHELAHYFLEGHVDHVLGKDGVHESRAGFVSADPYELEADNFAAGFLMPDFLFKPSIGKYAPGLAAVEGAASDCRTSLTATAIRYSELADHAVAAIISTGQTIDYCFLSDSMKSLPKLAWLRKGAPVPSATRTAEFNRDSDRVLAGERVSDEIDVVEWLSGTQSAKVVEEVIGLGNYGKTLTILSSRSIGREDDDEDGDEEERDLVERWTPRFRK
jgi:hypothetical protein